MDSYRMRKVLIMAGMLNPRFNSGSRQRALERLGESAEVEPYRRKELTAADADRVVGVIADSALFTRAFYEAANVLRIVTRRGVGFDKVNVEIATELGVVICVAPVHMSTVAEVRRGPVAGQLEAGLYLESDVPPRPI